MGCLVCGSAQVRLFLDDPDETLGHTSLGSTRTKISHGRILRCDRCRFGFRQTRPSQGELAELYREMDNAAYIAEARGRTRTARLHLRIVQQYSPRGRLLDVGSASGAFLDVAAQAGWSVVGVEPAASLVARARALLGNRGVVLETVLEDAPLAQSSFDAITLWDVLEHVPQPVEFMHACASLLRPGGHLFVNVPDLDSLQARVFGRRWPLLLAEHLNYFTHGSLRVCGQRARLGWRAFGRRPACFSIGYVLFRLSQHRVPGAAAARALAASGLVAGAIVPLPLGEVYGVWSRSA